jgi:YL1 nuclear protein
VDSDFDEPEEAPDDADAGPVPVSTRSAPSRGRARTGNYVDPALKKARPGRAARGDGPGRPAKRAKTRHDGDDEQGAVERTGDRSSLRKSTKAARELADKVRREREVDRNERRMLKWEREKDKEPEKILTQEELLKEADETAVQNTADLQVLLRLEEERKRIPKKAAVEQVPRMTVISRGGRTVINFKDKDADTRAALFPQAHKPSERAEASEPVKETTSGADPTAVRAVNSGE